MYQNSVLVYALYIFFGKIFQNRLCAKIFGLAIATFNNCFPLLWKKEPLSYPNHNKIYRNIKSVLIPINNQMNAVFH